MFRKILFSVLCALSCSGCLISYSGNNPNYAQNGLTIGIDYGTISRKNVPDGGDWDNNNFGFNIGIYGSKLELGFIYRYLGGADYYENEWSPSVYEYESDKISYSQRGVYAKYLVLGNNSASGLQGYVKAGISDYRFTDKFTYNYTNYTHPNNSYRYEKSERRDRVGISYGFGADYAFNNGFTAGVYWEAHTGGSGGKNYAMWGNVLGAKIAWRFNFKNQIKDKSILSGGIRLLSNPKDLVSDNKSPIRNSSLNRIIQQNRKSSWFSGDWFSTGF